MAVEGVFGVRGIAGGGAAGNVELEFASPLPTDIELPGSPRLLTVVPANTDRASMRLANVRYVRDAIDAHGGGTGPGPGPGYSGLDSVNESVSAAGTNQTEATPLTAQTNMVTAGAGGVRWDGPEAGDHRFVHNATPSAIVFYPPSGGQVNSQAANSGIFIQPNTTGFLKAISNTRLVTVP